MSRLTVDQVSVSFGGVHAVKAVSFAADDGNIVGLIGPNGAGKSTLLNCISGITPPTDGRVLLDASTISGIAIHRVASRGLTRVFQHPEIILDYTVIDNLLVALHRHLDYGLIAELFSLPSARAAERSARQAAEAALSRVGLARLGSTPVAGLSYGHRKLVELARALLTRSTFLLLDEPVAGLNEQEIDRLTELLATLRSEDRLGIILVEHNMRIVSRLCDHVVVLDAGAVIAQGTPDEVLADPKVKAAYLGSA